MSGELMNKTPTKDEFMALLWERASDEALSHRPITLGYMQMYAEYNGWDKPEKIDSTKTMEVEVYIGGVRVER
jgi:hypothetical protein